MSIFNNLMEGIGLRKPDYGRLNVEVPTFNTQPTMDRLKALEAKVDAPITGPTEAGVAAQDSARRSFEEQTQRAQSRAQSDAASKAAQAGIFGGISSGATERAMRDSSERQAELEQAQAGEQSRALSEIGAQDIQNLQGFQRQGLMALPGMFQGLEQSRVNTQLGGVGAQLDQQRTNSQLGLQERADRKRALGGLGSTLFGKAGAGLSLFG